MRGIGMRGIGLRGTGMRGMGMRGMGMRGMGMRGIGRHRGRGRHLGSSEAVPTESDTLKKNAGLPSSVKFFLNGLKKPCLAPPQRSQIRP